MARTLTQILPTTLHHFEHRPGGRLGVVDGDVNHQRREGGTHNVALIEGELPHAFEISCSCGQQTWTPWGLEMAEEIAAMHLWEVGAPPKGKVYL